MRAWQLQDAKSRFSELVDQAVAKGPQIVTKRGVESVVVLSIDHYRSLKRPKGDLVSFLKQAPKAELDLKRKKDKDRSIEL